VRCDLRVRLARAWVAAIIQFRTRAPVPHLIEMSDGSFFLRRGPFLWGNPVDDSTDTLIMMMAWENTGTVVSLRSE
jgi:hypothetical protein